MSITYVEVSEDPKAVFNCRFGTFKHSDMIGKSFGSKVLIYLISIYWDSWTSIKWRKHEHFKNTYSLRFLLRNKAMFTYYTQLLSYGLLFFLTELKFCILQISHILLQILKLNLVLL